MIASWTILQLEGRHGFRASENRFSMKSSPNSTDQPFANGGGIDVAVPSDDDPYRALDELMAVVEALCPQWPERGVFVDSGKMLL